MIKDRSSVSSDMNFLFSADLRIVWASSASGVGAQPPQQVQLFL